MNNQSIELAKLALRALTSEERENLLKEVTPQKIDYTNDRRLLTFTEVAETLGLSRTTIWRLVRDGRLPVIEIREGRNRIPAAAVARFVEGVAQ